MHSHNMNALTQARQKVAEEEAVAKVILRDLVSMLTWEYKVILSQILDADLYQQQKFLAQQQQMQQFQQYNQPLNHGYQATNSLSQSPYVQALGAQCLGQGFQNYQNPNQPKKTP